MTDNVFGSYKKPDFFPTRLENVLKFCSSDRIRPSRYSEKVRLANLRANKRHAKLYPERVIARNKAKYHIKEQPCEVCGTIENIQRHHANYNNHLDIIFLCRKHHRELHSWDFIGNIYNNN